MMGQTSLPFPTVNHIGVSGGKDSTALLLWAVHESGYARGSLDVTFCDTGNEHQFTYAFVEMLSRKVFPIKTLKPERDFYELAKHRQRFPGVMSRFCTQELKMFPTRDHCFALSNQGFRVVLHSGVRADESAERAQLPDREFDGFYGLECFRPLLRWKLEDVWAIHERYGIKPNPLYAAGAKRVGCLPCIMSRKDEIRNIATRWPERIDMIREAELSPSFAKGISTFFSRDKVPLRFRSKEITANNGERMKVATIDDVVRWSATGKRATGIASGDDVKSCPSSLGQCE